MIIRLRLPHGTQPADFEVEEGTPWVVFLHALENRSGIVKECMRLLTGYPPRPITAQDGDVVGNILRQGDILILQEGEATVVKGVSTGRYIPPANERWHFTRRICPSDNSCLFHAAAYVLRNKSRTEGSKLREECAAVVEANPAFFNEVLLEMTNREYVEWIRRPTSWGGIIELLVLSFLSQTEIIALDLESSRMERVGQDKGYTVRAFLVYTGKHYDAIAMNSMYNSSNEGDDQVLFSVSDEFVIGRAARFVQEEAQRLKQ